MVTDNHLAPFSLFVEGQMADFWILPFVLYILLPQLILTYPGQEPLGGPHAVSYLCAITHAGLPACTEFLFLVHLKH